MGNGETGRVQSQRNQPVTGIAHRQEDSGIRLLNRVVSTTARRALHTLSRNEEIRIFLVPLPWGSECSGNYQPRGNGKTARGIGSADPSRLPPVPGTESPLEIWLGRSTAPEHWQAPGLREFRFAESQQILPLTGNRKSASAVPADPTRHGNRNRQEDRRVRLQN